MNKILWMSLDDAGVFVSRRKPYINHAIALLRTVLYNAGIKTDFKTLRYVWQKEQVRDRVYGYDILLMSVMSFNFPYAVAVAKIFKECNPAGKVIVGGVHASVGYKEMKAVKEFDSVVKGPGEKVVVDTIKHLGAGQKLTYHTQENSLEQWPNINRDLFPEPLEDYSPLVEPPTVTMITSRKCKYNCSFCNERSLFDDAERMKATTVITHLNNTYTKHPFKSVIFHDSNFFDDPQWLNEFIRQYTRQKRGYWWPYWCAARSNVVCKYPEILKEMVLFSHLDVLSLGLESGSDNVLKILNKGCTADQNMKAIELCNTLDLTIYANIMLGIPGENRADAMATVDMVNSIKNAIVSVSFYTPYPGTVLGDKVIASGMSLVEPGDYHRYPGKALVKNIDYKWYCKKVLPKIKGYRPVPLTEKIGRYFCGKLARRLLK